MRVATSFATLILLSGLWAESARPAAAAGDRDRAAARSAAEAGADAYEQGRFADAIDLFGRAEQLLHAPPHLLFIARSQVKLGKLVDARETYLKITKEALSESAPAAFKRAYAEAQTEGSAVEARLASATVTVTGRDAREAVVTLDGADLPGAALGIPLPVDPGEHVFTARSPRAKSTEVRVTFGDGAKKQVTLELGPEAGAPPSAGLTAPLPGAESAAEITRPGPSPWGFISLGAGLAASGVGTYFLVKYLSAHGDANDYFDDCNPGCTLTQKAELKTLDDNADKKRNYAIVGFAVGGVGIATGVILLATSAPGRASTGALSRGVFKDVRLHAGLNWVGASGRF